MKLTKTLPPPWNRTLLVSTHAYRRYWIHSLGKIHGEMLTAIQRWVQPGAVVWDIGANMGVFAFASAFCAGVSGKVYAFEADLDCASFIEHSQRWKLAEEAPVTIFPIAVADTTGPVTFEISTYRSAASAIEGFGRFSGKGGIRNVPAFAIDDLAESYASPALLKIDVEGAENLVLQGARKTIERHRPLLFVECSGSELGVETAKLFRSLGYEWKPWLSDGAFSQEGVPGGDLVARAI